MSRPQKITDDQVVAAVVRADGNRTKAAKLLGVSVAAVYWRLRRIDTRDLPPATKRDHPSTVDDWWAAYDRRRSNTYLRNILVEHYLDVVNIIVQYYQRRLPTTVDPADIQQAAYDGLTQTVERFNPTLGVKFQTYAYRKIRGAIIDYLRSVDPSPRLTLAKARRRKEAEAELTQVLGRYPTDDEMCKRMGCTYRELLTAGIAKTDSIDRPIHHGESKEVLFLDSLADDTKQHAAFVFADATRGISFEQRVVLWLYYRVGLTMKEVGKILRMSEAWVSLNLTKSLSQLKTLRKPEDFSD